MEHDRTLSQIARGLTWIGGGFLVASAAVIVWAVFRTVGVDDLLVALTVAGLGLGLPAIVAFVVAWILNSLGHGDAEADERTRPSRETPSPLQRPALTSVALGATPSPCSRASPHGGCASRSIRCSASR